MSPAQVLAGLAGAIVGVCFVLEVIFAASARLAKLMPFLNRVVDFAEQVVAPLRRADRVGAGASVREQVRLSAAAAAVGAVLGTMLVGPLVGLAAATVAVPAASRSVGWRANRYRRGVDADAAAAARALAGAMASGRSIRACFAPAASELRGPIAAELKMVAAELELGVRTDLALASLRERVRSRRVDLIAAAIELQRSSGGNLAALLRSISATIEESDRLRDEARAASAQARFTSTIVLAMPLGGMLLGELAAPGLAGRLLASPVSLVLLLIALCMQAVGAAVVHRVARVRW